MLFKSKITFKNLVQKYVMASNSQKKVVEAVLESHKINFKAQTLLDIYHPYKKDKRDNLSG